MIRLSTTYHGASLCLLLGPVPAVRKALAKAGWSVDEVDLFELNEAFAAQAIAVLRSAKHFMFFTNYIDG